MKFPLATVRVENIQLRHTFEDTDSSAEVIHSSGSLEGSGDDRGGGDEIVGEGVVEVALIPWVISQKSYDSQVSQLGCGLKLQ